MSRKLIINDTKDMILFFQNDVRPSAHTLSLLHLPHPKGGLTTYTTYNFKFYELNVVQPRRHASWFIDQNVSSEKGFYFATEIDIRLLLLPFFERSGTKFSPLDQIVYLESSGDGIPLESFKSWKMEQVFDVNDKLGEDMILFRYNEVKAVVWLVEKVKRCAAALSQICRTRQNKENASFVKGFNVSTQNTATASHADNSDVIHSGKM